MDIQLHHHKSFRKALRQLDNQSVGAIQKAIMDFEENPKSPSLNFEPLHGGARDFHSIRASRDLRIILAKVSGEGGTHDHWLAVYVDHHDKAYDWAQNRSLQYIDQTQTFNILVNPGEEMETQPQVSHAQHQTIERLTDHQLFQLGVPEVLLPNVRSIQTEKDLKKLEDYLPDLTVEALGFILLEMSFDEVKETLEAGKIQAARTPSEILQSPNNQRQISTLRRTDELERFYSGDFQDWMIYLHHTQRLLADGQFNGTVKVTGGAGTGKTVVALHRAKFLQENRRDDRPILFTTYNKNLAENLENQFQLLSIDPQKVVLKNIHKWLTHFAFKEGFLHKDIQIVEMTDKLDSSKIWKEVLKEAESSWDLAFIKEEWEEVILNFDVRSWENYRQIRRSGRGDRLSENQRKEVWTLMEVYEQKIRQLSGMHQARMIYDMVQAFKEGELARPFSHIIVDEVQDFGMAELSLIRQLTEEGSNDLFLCGDPLQKIYNTKFSFAQAGISVRGRRSQHLKINYRTTEEIRSRALSVIRGEEFKDFEGESWKERGYYSLFRGEDPVYADLPSSKEEEVFIIETINQLYDKGYPIEEICVCAFRGADLKRIIKAFHKDNIPYFDLRNGSGSLTGVRISSFHGVKGMEFKAVILTGCGHDQLPHKFRGFNLLLENRQQEAIRSQKALIYVGMTRARDQLILTGKGDASEWVKE